MNKTERIGYQNFLRMIMIAEEKAKNIRLKQMKKTNPDKVVDTVAKVGDAIISEKKAFPESTTPAYISLKAQALAKLDK